MNDQDIEELIRRELFLAADTDPSAFAYGALPEWSSSSHMNVVIAVEEAYGIEFSPDEIADLTDVPRIVAAVRRRMDAAA